MHQTANKLQSEKIVFNGTIRTRVRPKQIYIEEINKDMVVANLTEEMALNISKWKKKIHLVEPKSWNRGFVVVVVHVFVCVCCG